MELNKVYCENCLDTMKRMPDGFIDLTVTSPPYNMRTRIRNGKYTTREKGEHFSKKYAHFGDDLDIDDFYELHRSVLSELLRVSKVVCYNFQIVTGSKEAFFKLMGYFSESIKDVMVWDKGHGQPSMHEKCLNSSYELILILEQDGKKGRVIQNAKFKRGEMSNILRLGRGKRIEGTHGAVFPEELPAQLLLAFSNENDVIYDPFSGTGTTWKMSLLNNRRFVGSEISEEYVKLSENRVKDLLPTYPELE